MVSSLAFGWFTLLADEYAQLGKHVASGAAFIVNFVVAGEAGYFDNSAETKPMLHLWSLAVEEQFYIIWPLALWLAWKGKLNLLTLTVLVALGSFYLNITYANSNPTETFFWSVGRFWELLSGSLLAWLMLYKKEELSNVKLWIDQYLVRLLRSQEASADGTTTSNLMSLSGISLLIYGVIQIHEGLAWPSTWALIPISGALLMIAAGPKACLNRWLLMNPIAIWFGLISYPLYLWHWPILSYLHIIEGELPHKDARMTAIVVAVLLAWVTYKWIESPIRFGKLKPKVSTAGISITLMVVGIVGYFISTANLSETHSYENMLFKRAGLEHKIGSSFRWYEGKNDWLFLGNDYGDTVAKRKLAITPTDTQIKAVRNQFVSLMNASSEIKTQVALFIGPNKSSVYTEFLPDKLIPSEKRYSTFFTDALSELPNLVVHDPTIMLQSMNASEGLLYYRTDTHWNAKGAFLAYSSFLNRIGFPTPRVEFNQATQYRGDLIGISKLFDYPVHSDDTWDFVIHQELNLQTYVLPNQPESDFGSVEVVKNSTPLSETTVWIVGDSFTKALRPYLNATFKEVHYLGHWASKLKDLPLELSSAEKKPDLIIVIGVERSF